MSFKSWLAIAALTLGALGVTACATSVCEDGEQQCGGVDDEQVQTCENGQWSEPSDCDPDMACMTMGNGVEHCMGGSM